MLVLENIRKTNTIGNTRKNVLDYLSAYFPDTGFIGIKGSSGSGKSTLLNVISHLEEADGGRILFDGNELDNTYLRKEVAIIAQNDDLISVLNVKENILIGAKIAKKTYREKDFKRLVKVLELNDHLDKYPHQLSGGLKKRVSIARALLKNSSILLCDEPTGALHYQQSIEVMKLLKEVSKDRLVIIVSHDNELLEQFCDKIFLLEDGKINCERLEINGKDKKEEKSKQYSLLFYILKQIKSHKFILFFLLFFEVIVVVSLFLLVSGMNGIEYELNRTYENAVQKNLITIENFDSMPFDKLLDKNSHYDYILSLGEISLDKNMKFMPSSCLHIQLSSGRLPEDNHEVIVSYELRKYLNNNLNYVYNGQNISLTVVGVLYQDFFKEECIYFPDTFCSLIPDYINKNMIVIESDKSEELYKKLSEQYIVYNEPLEQKESYMTLIILAKSILYIFFFISLISSFFLSYITYQTLGVIQKKDSALLLMQGLTIKELFILHMIESAVIGIIMSSIGIIGCLIAYYYINDVFGLYNIFSFSLKYNSLFLLIIGVVYIFINIITAYIPFKKLINTHLVSILREE